MVGGEVPYRFEEICHIRTIARSAAGCPIHAQFHRAWVGSASELTTEFYARS